MIMAILIVQTLTIGGLVFICWALNAKIEHMWEQFHWYRECHQERIRALEGRP